MHVHTYICTSHVCSCIWTYLHVGRESGACNWESSLAGYDGWLCLYQFRKAKADFKFKIRLGCILKPCLIKHCTAGFMSLIPALNRYARLWIQGQFGIHSKSRASHGYIERLCLKRNKTKQMNKTKNKQKTPKTLLCRQSTRLSWKIQVICMKETWIYGTINVYMWVGDLAQR